MRKIMELSVGILTATVVLAGCGAAKNDNVQSKTSQSSSSKPASSTATQVTQWHQSDIDALKTGDLMNKGAGGANYNDIVKQFGEPATKTTATVNNLSVLNVGWTNAVGNPGESRGISLIGFCKS